MDEMKERQVIKALRSKWIMYSVLADALIAIGIAFLLAVITNKFFGWSFWWGMFYGCIILFVLILFRQVWKTKETGIAKLLDETYPQLEESTGLLLHSPDALNLLESLQFKKTAIALAAIDAPLPVAKKITRPFVLLLVMVAVGIALNKIPFNRDNQIRVKENQISTIIPKKEIILPQIISVHVVIKPPAYTAKQIRQQHAFNLVAEQGAAVNWQLQTNVTASQVKFIFNDTLKIALQATNAAKTNWQLEKKIDSTGFYQLSIDGHVSELYKIETIRDQLPVVNIVSPKQYTTIEYGESQQVKMNTTVTDDYGIKDAFITATIASGSGEAVKFKEQKIALQGFIAGKMQYQLQQILALQKLGMQPGDELYFYVQATDNHQQEVRSDIHIVHLPDTAQLMSLEGLGNSLTIKPDYFRSQRQIIIETEQLLKDRDTISAETFKNKSNNLGIDQKLLRLRYGKFLGDESSGETTGAEGLGDIADFNNAEKVADAFTDKHDNAEDATFLDPETKKQLRATLNEMWSSELHLRTFTPKEALPFQYKALRLLKDLQQKSRAYVAKANFKTTPLDLKKRLTGDLSKIEQSQLQKDITKEPDLQLPVRNALSILEKIKEKQGTDDQQGVLQQANLRLHEKAVQQPALYLNAVEALKRIMAGLSAGKEATAKDITTAQYGLQQMLNEPSRLPSAAKDNSKQALSKQYFQNLQNRQP